MKKNLILIIAILFLVLLLTNCESSQIEYSDESFFDNVRKEVKASHSKDTIYLIEWKDQYYYV